MNFFFLFIGFKVAAWAGRTVAFTVWVGRTVAAWAGRTVAFTVRAGGKVAAWADRTVTGVLDSINALCNALRLRPHLTKDLNR